MKFDWNMTGALDAIDEAIYHIEGEIDKLEGELEECGRVVK